MNRVLKYSCVLILLFGFSKLKAQNFEDDAAVWLDIYLEKKINDKFDVHLKNRNRINNNISEYGLGYADIGLTYNYNKNIKVLADYVFAKIRKLDGTYRNRHRVYAALILRKKLGSFTISYRNRVQTQVHSVYTSENGRVPEWTDRNKLTVKYDINKRFTISIAEELYLPFYQVKHKGLSRSRSTAGLLYNISKKAGIECYFMYQNELNSFNRTNRDFIYGLAYSREF